MPAPRRRDGAGPDGPPRTRPDACPGAWRRHEAADGALARFRPVGGATTATELRLLAAAADDAPLELTSRGSWQVRGLSQKGADGLADALSRVGGSGVPAPLLDDRGRDVPCSVVASPRSAAVDAPARAVADALRGRTDVPGRLLVALDDGTGDVAGLGADVTVVLGAPVALHLAGTPTDVIGDDPAALVLAAVEAFLAVRGDAWRVAEVGADRVLDALDRPVAGPTGWYRSPGERYQPVAAHRGARPRLGLGADGVLEVLPRLGEVDRATAEVLAGLADEGATLRVTPWRTLVLRGLGDRVDLADGRARLEGLVETGPSPWANLSACVGAPRCARSHTDVRGDLSRAVAAGRAGGTLPAHWVGCERACGTPAGPVAVVEGTPSGTYRTVVRAGRVSA